MSIGFEKKVVSDKRHHVGWSTLPAPWESGRFPTLTKLIMRTSSDNVLMMVMVVLACSSNMLCYKPCVAWHNNLPATTTMNRRALLTDSSKTFFGGSIVLSWLTSPATVSAEETVDETSASSVINSQPTRRPFAPLEALVPAMQQRILLERVVDLTRQLSNQESSSSSSFDSKRQAAVVSQLKLLLESPSTKSSPLSKSATRATRRYVTTTLQHIPSTRLSGAATRAAMNKYAANLRYSENYVLTASSAEKSRLLRTKGRFPDVQQVITADLDLRDLYRNLVQTTLDDLIAEVYYYDNASGDEEPDVAELVRLATDAATAFDKWLSFIDANEVDAARARTVSLLSQ